MCPEKRVILFKQQAFTIVFLFLNFIRARNTQLIRQAEDEAPSKQENDSEKVEHIQLPDENKESETKEVTDKSSTFKWKEQVHFKEE